MKVSIFNVLCFKFLFPNLFCIVHCASIGAFVNYDNLLLIERIFLLLILFITRYMFPSICSVQFLHFTLVVLNFSFYLFLLSLHFLHPKIILSSSQRHYGELLLLVTYLLSWSVEYVRMFYNNTIIYELKSIYCISIIKNWWENLIFE